MIVGLQAPPAVAPGGVLVAHVAAHTRVQERVDDRWVARPDAFRAPLRPGHLVLRARDPRGATSKIVVVRVRPLTLAAVGDVNLAEGPGSDIARHGAAYPWRLVGPALRSADITIANLECAVSRRGAPATKRTTFEASPTAIPALRRVAGIDLVSFANNHAGDFGDDALLDGLTTLRRNRIATIGAGRDTATASRPVVVSRLGLRVAFVGFSDVPPRSFAATATSPGVAWARADRIRAAVRAAAARSDVVVAFFHWGREGARTENRRQRALARVAFEAGATVIIGAHPHVLQPIRRAAGRLVAYSLGNFVFRPRGPGADRAGILNVALARGRVLSSHLRSTRIVGTQPRPVRSETARQQPQAKTLSRGTPSIATMAFRTARPFPRVSSKTWLVDRR